VRRTLSSFCALFALAGCAAATAPSAPLPGPTAADTALILAEGVSRDPGEHPSGAYQLDSRHAYVWWRVRHTGLGLYAGRFDRIAGSLDFVADDPAKSKLRVEIDAASISTGLVDDPDRDFDAQIANTVLNAKAHPKITFVSESISVTGPISGEIAGTLSIGGMSLPATLRGTFEGGRFVVLRGRHILAFTGSLLVNRSAFGAKFPNPLADAAVSDDVEILVAAEFMKE
jgi:polyisoprenoid-binding protein YceI